MSENKNTPFETNNPAWKSGYNGHNNTHTNPDDSYDHERGRLQRVREEEERQKKNWG